MLPLQYACRSIDRACVRHQCWESNMLMLDTYLPRKFLACLGSIIVTTRCLCFFLIAWLLRRPHTPFSALDSPAKAGVSISMHLLCHGNKLRTSFVPSRQMGGLFDQIYGANATKDSICAVGFEPNDKVCMYACMYVCMCVCVCNAV